MATRSRSPRRAYWLGRVVRRAWQGYERVERRVIGRLAAKGWPVGGARALLWIAKLGVLAILLYAAVWMAFVLILVVACLWMVAHADLEQDDPQPKWRDGLLGFGLYHPDGSRIDPHDPDEEV